MTFWHSVTPQGRNLWLFLCNPLDPTPAFLQSSLLPMPRLCRWVVSIFEHHQTSTSKGLVATMQARPQTPCFLLTGTDLVVQNHCKVRNGDLDQVPRECLLWDALTCGTVICCPSFLPVQVKLSFAALVHQGCVTLQNKLGKKSVSCQRVGICPTWVVPGGHFQLFSLLEGGLPIPAVCMDGLQCYLQ